MFRGFWRAATVLVVLGAATAAVIRAQSPTPTAGNPQVLSELLTEVRGLRAAMEQMASTTARVQLSMGRLQLQEQRITTLMRQLEAVRSNLAAAAKEEDKVRETLRRDEEVSRTALDPEERRQMAFVVQIHKGELSRATADVQRLQADEASALQMITQEQGRWTEISQRLEELERSLLRK